MLFLENKIDFVRQKTLFLEKRTTVGQRVYSLKYFFDNSGYIAINNEITSK